MALSLLVGVILGFVLALGVLFVLHSKRMVRVQLVFDQFSKEDLRILGGVASSSPSTASGAGSGVVGVGAATVGSGPHLSSASLTSVSSSVSPEVVPNGGPTTIDSLQTESIALAEKTCLLLPIQLSLINTENEPKVCEGVLEIQFAGRMNTRKQYQCYLQSKYLVFKKMAFMHSEKPHAFSLKDCYVRRLSDQTPDDRYQGAIEIIHKNKQMSPKSDYIFLWPKKQESDKWMAELGKICSPSFHYDLAAIVPTEHRESPEHAQSIPAIATSSEPTLAQSSPAQITSVQSSSNSDLSGTSKRARIKSIGGSWLNNLIGSDLTIENSTHTRTRSTAWSSPYDPNLNQDFDSIILGSYKNYIPCQGWIKLQKGDTRKTGSISDLKNKVNRFCVLRGNRMLHFSSEKVMSPGEYGEIYLQGCKVEAVSDNFKSMLVIRHPTNYVVTGSNHIFLLFSNDQIRDLWMTALSKAVDPNISLLSDQATSRIQLPHVGDATNTFGDMEWFNSFAKRMFCSLVASKDFKDTLKRKFQKKLDTKMEESKLENIYSNLLDGLIVEDLQISDKQPEIKQAKSLPCAEGATFVELCIEYGGSFNLVLSTNIQLRSGINMRFSVSITNFSGKMLLHMTALPVNRLSVAFREMPYMAINVDTVVGDKAVTVAKAAIEKKLKAIFAQRFVVPNRLYVRLPPQHFP